MDLQALMMGSESLLTHIARPDGIPRLDKSLAEIVSACRIASLFLSLSLFIYVYWLPAAEYSPTWVIPIDTKS